MIDSAWQYSGNMTTTDRNKLVGRLKKKFWLWKGIVTVHSSKNTVCVRFNESQIEFEAVRAYLPEPELWGFFTSADPEYISA